MKKVGIIFAATLTLIAASYSGFWFYRSYSITKELNNLSKNSEFKSSLVSIGEVSTSGFPLAQNITLKNITLQNNDLENEQPSSSSSIQITLKNIDLKGTPFSSNFTVEKIGDILFKDLEKEDSSFALRFSECMSNC